MNRNKSQTEHDDTLSRVDEYYAAMLNCDAHDLRACGWKPLVSRSEDDPMTLLFGMRQVVYLLAPICEGSHKAGPAGVASLAEELSDIVGDLLKTAKPHEFFRPDLLMRLDQLVRDSVKRPLAPGCEPRLNVFYATLGSFQPYMGPWVEWIEQLDESTESDPFALALLARHSGGVFVVRHHGSIVAYTGLHACSPYVWELTPPRLTASAHARSLRRTDDLLTALIARATRAAVNGDHIPICTISPRETKLQRALFSAGYRYYANASVYATTAS